MAQSHLAGLLQHQLAADSNAFSQLPVVLASLDKQHFENKASTTKWTNRLNSLVHSKDVSVRWSALCLIHKTCQLSLPTMLEHAEKWIALVLPMLSVSISKHRG